MTITMVGRLEDCLLLSYRTPAESVRHLLPRGLEPMTHGPFAFWNVVACRVIAMRLAGLPAIAGMSFHHIAYRLYVRTATAAGEECGLYFLRSDVDRASIATAGNWLTDFRFHSAPIAIRREPGAISYELTTGEGAALIAVELGSADTAADSCFDSPEEAARVLKYRPVSFAPDAAAISLRLAEVHRDERRWEERPVQVVESRFKPLDALGQDSLILERAVHVPPIDYRWRLGRRVDLVARNRITEGRLPGRLTGPPVIPAIP